MSVSAEIREKFTAEEWRALQVLPGIAAEQDRLRRILGCKTRSEAMRKATALERKLDKLLGNARQA